MRIPHSSSLNRELGVSMTPMIDVVFLLLIFFICTASFQIVESILPSQLLEAGSATAAVPQKPEPLDLETIVVAVRGGEGRTSVLVNEQSCPTMDRLSELLRTLADVDETLPIVLDVDGTVPLGDAIDAYDRCRLAGFKRIQFATSVQ